MAQVRTRAAFIAAFIALLAATPATSGAAEEPTARKQLEREDVLFERIVVEKLRGDQLFIQGRGAGTGNEAACACEDVLLAECLYAPEKGRTSSSPDWLQLKPTPKGGWWSEPPKLDKANGQKLYWSWALQCVDAKRNQGRCATMPWSIPNPLVAAKGDDGTRKEIKGDGCSAWGAYQFVLDAISDLRTSGFEGVQTEDRQNVLHLLELDAQYRQLLLERQLPFWGGMFVSQPDIPIRLANRMTDQLAAFEKQSHEITERVWRNQDTTKDALTALASAVGEEGSIRENELREAQAREQVSESARTGRLLNEQATQLIALYQSIDDAAAQARAERDAAGQAMNGALMDLAMSSAGVSPELVKGLQQGDAGAGLKALAGAALSGDSGGIPELKGLTESINGAIKNEESVQKALALYREGKNLKDKIDTLRGAGEDVADLLRNPSLDSLAKVGKHVETYCGSQNPKPSYCTKASDLLAKAPPAFALINSVDKLRSLDWANLDHTGKQLCATSKDVFGALAELDGNKELSQRDAAVKACGVIDLARNADLCDPASLSDLGQALGDRGIAVDSGKIASITRATRQACSVRTNVAAILDEGNRIESQLADWLDALDSVVAASPDAVEDIYAGMLAQLDQATNKQAKTLLNTAVMVWAKPILERLGSQAAARPALDALAGELELPPRANGETQDHFIDRLSAALAKRGAASISTIRVNNLAIELRLGGRTVASLSGQDLVSVVRQHTAAMQEGIAAARAGLRTIAQEKGQLRRLLLERTPPAIQEQLVRREAERLGPSRGERLQRDLWSRVDADVGAPRIYTGDQGAAGGGVDGVSGQALLLGQALVQTVQRAPEIPGAPQPRTGSSSGNFHRTEIDPNAQQQKAMVAMALNYAFPGAGLALQAVDSYFAMQNAQQRLEKLADERFHTTMMMVHLQETAYNALRDEHAAQYQVEIARVAQDTARSRAGLYRSQVQALQENSQEAKRQIYERRPLAFYYSEQLRETFARLDQSIGLWLGQDRRPGRELQRLIESDPQNLRYATDADINLFDWFRTDIEGQRTDVDGMMLHWRQKLALVQHACEHSCQPGAENLGQVQQTDFISVKDLVGPTQWGMFEAWQKQHTNDRAPFQFSVLIYPGIGPFKSTALNHRVMMVRAGITNSGKVEEATGDSIEIQHPGFAVVPTLVELNPPRIELRREYLIPKSYRAYDPPDRFSLENLSQRWSLDKAPIQAPFEGYGLFTAWTVKVTRSDRTRSATDIVLRFAYTSIDSEAINTEEAFVRALGTQNEALLGVQTRDWAVCWQTARQARRAEVPCNGIGDGRGAGPPSANTLTSSSSADVLRAQYLAALFPTGVDASTTLDGLGRVVLEKDPPTNDATSRITIKSKPRTCESLRGREEEQLASLIITYRTGNEKAAGAPSLDEVRSNLRDLLCKGTVLACGTGPARVVPVNAMTCDASQPANSPDEFLDACLYLRDGRTIERTPARLERCQCESTRLARARVTGAKDTFHADWVRRVGQRDGISISGYHAGDGGVLCD